jgi:hypothetical protein
MARDAADLQWALDGFLKSATDHVVEMRRSAEQQLSGRQPATTSPLRPLLTREAWNAEGVRGDGLILGVAGTPMESVTGNLHGRGNLLTERSGDDREIDMALGLFEPMDLAHHTAPYLRWSYYFSARGDFLTIYPYAGEHAFIRAVGLGSVDEYLAAMHGYDVYRLGTPSENPTRTSY